jgi:hypothetical protein
MGDAITRPLGGVGGLLGALYGVTSDPEAGDEEVIDPVTRKVIRRKAVPSSGSTLLRAAGYGLAGALAGGFLGRGISRLPLDNSKGVS